MADRHATLYHRIASQHARPRARDAVDLLLVTNNFSTGGAQSSARRLLGALRDRGVRVAAAVLQEQIAYPTPGRRALESNDIRVHAAPRAGAHDPVTTCDSVIRFADACGAERVVFWNVIPEHKVILADRLVGVSIHDVSPGEMFFRSLERYFDSPQLRHPYLSARDYGALLRSVIVKYAGEADRARATLGAEVSVIPNGIVIPHAGPTRLARACGERLVIGTLARIGPDKRLEDLLEAFRIAEPHLPPCVLRIAGAPETGFEDYAKALKNRDRSARVQWVGEQSADEFLRDLDLFALVAEPAGCPNASLEAMAAGLPVVATDVGGMSAQVEHGRTGWLAARGDPSALARALVSALSSPADLPAMGRAAFERARTHFSLDRMVDSYASVLELR